MTQFGTCAYSNSSIQKLYLTKWTNDVITYFTTDGDVMSITGITEAWNQIDIDTVSVSFAQSMNPPNPNGINYTENIDIVIPKSEIDKWLDLIDILIDRYVIVFQDGNRNWYVMGWKFGSKVKSYTMSENQYILSFVNSFTTSLIRTISESYVTSNII